ncbi:hypothetical protein F5Y17DRAFT_454301 [Xylariaceae sp. FL0594]|nr:hypothetical protein F5Y17DRAFT_454301 [Xylariaceae sp. FL0594]
MDPCMGYDTPGRTTGEAGDEYEQFRKTRRPIQPSQSFTQRHPQQGQIQSPVSQSLIQPGQGFAQHNRQQRQRQSPNQYGQGYAQHQQRQPQANSNYYPYQSHPMSSGQSQQQPQLSRNQAPRSQGLQTFEQQRPQQPLPGQSAYNPVLGSLQQGHQLPQQQQRRSQQYQQPSHQPHLNNNFQVPHQHQAQPNLQHLSLHQSPAYPQPQQQQQLPLLLTDDEKSEAIKQANRRGTGQRAVPAIVQPGVELNHKDFHGQAVKAVVGNRRDLHVEDKIICTGFRKDNKLCGSLVMNKSGSLSTHLTNHHNENLTKYAQYSDRSIIYVCEGHDDCSEEISSFHSYLQHKRSKHEWRGDQNELLAHRKIG